MKVMVKTNETLSIEKYQIRSYLKDFLNNLKIPDTQKIKKKLKLTFYPLNTLVENM